MPDVMPFLMPFLSFNVGFLLPTQSVLLQQPFPYNFSGSFSLSVASNVFLYPQPPNEPIFSTPSLSLLITQIFLTPSRFLLPSAFQFFLAETFSFSITFFYPLSVSTLPRNPQFFHSCSLQWKLVAVCLSQRCIFYPPFTVAAAVSFSIYMGTSNPKPLATSSVFAAKGLPEVPCKLRFFFHFF